MQRHDTAKLGSAHLPAGVTRAVLAFASIAFYPGQAATASGPSFFDSFETFDEKRWYVSDGWANGPHQNCQWSRDQISVADGVLRLSFETRKTRLRDHACAEIQSRAQLGYGTYEVRMRTPSGAGLNAAFFTFLEPDGPDSHQEIDVEVLLKDTGRVETNTYVAGVGGNGKLVPVPQPTDTTFTDFAFVWEPQRIRWYVNGRLVRTLDDPEKISTPPQKLFASLWGTDTLVPWMGHFEPSSEPRVMEIDHIAYTAPEEGCQFEGSVVCDEN